MIHEPNLKCPVCGHTTNDQYMVTENCWNEAGFDFFDNVHLKCLEKQLKRLLVSEDFVDAPINEWIQTATKKWTRSMRHGRKKPYTEIGVKRIPCAKCSEPATQQWYTCADGLWRPICIQCDIELNRLVLQFMQDPDCNTKIARYRESLCEHKN